jgi:transposase-like protein
MNRVITPTPTDVQTKPPRQQRSAEFKAMLVARMQQPGATFEAVASAAGVNTNLLRKWVCASKAGSKPKLRGTQANTHTSVGRSFARVTVQDNHRPTSEAANTDAIIPIQINKGTVQITMHIAPTQMAELLKVLTQ